MVGNMGESNLNKKDTKTYCRHPNREVCGNLPCPLLLLQLLLLLLLPSPPQVNPPNIPAWARQSRTKSTKAPRCVWWKIPAVWPAGEQIGPWMGWWEGPSLLLHRPRRRTLVRHEPKPLLDNTNVLIRWKLLAHYQNFLKISLKSSHNFSS